KGRLKKKGKQAGLFRLSAVAAALVMALPCYGVDFGYIANKNQTVGDDVRYAGALDVGIYAVDGNSVGFEGKTIEVDSVPGTGWGSGNVGVWVDGSNDNQSKIILGKSGVTDSVSVNVRDTSASMKENLSIGLWASRNNKKSHGGLIEVNAKNLTVTGSSSKNGWIYGIYVQNKTTASDKELATVIINADNTVVNVTSDIKGRAAGLVAMSQGILKVNGNLEVNADNAIMARGGTIVHVNETGDKTVRLNGNINFDYDKATSETGVDADVLVNLTGADSVWNGNATVSYGTGEPDEEGKLVVNGLKVGISDGAQWNPTQVEEFHNETEGVAVIPINQLTMNDGIINIKTAGQEVKVENLTGTGGTLNIAAEADSSTETGIKTGILSVGSVTGDSPPGLTTNFTGITADDLKDAATLGTAAAAAVIVGNSASTGTIAQTATVREGVLKGAMTATVDETGAVTSFNEARNSGTDALQKI
ncbi:hypothetical protein NAI82_11450, partial [Oxalobacter sp. JAC-2022]